MDRRKRILFWGIITIYAITVCWQVLDIGDFNIRERRKLTEWPMVQVRSSEDRKNFFKQLTEASRDQFALRTTFYFAIRSLRYYVFGMPASFLKITSDGYIWEPSDFHSLVRHNHFPKKTLTHFQKHLKKQMLRYRKKNIRFHFFDRSVSGASPQ